MKDIVPPGLEWRENYRKENTQCKRKIVKIRTTSPLAGYKWQSYFIILSR